MLNSCNLRFASNTGLYVANQTLWDCIPLGQDCSDVNWKCKPITMLICTYLDDFKSFGYDNVDAKGAIAITCCLYMILNALLIHGLIADLPKFIDGYQIGNFLSTIALMSTLVYVSYLNLRIIS